MYTSKKEGNAIMNIRMKLVLFFSIAFLLGTSIIGTYSITQVYDKTVKTAQHKVKSDLALGRALLNERYPGEWSLQNDELYKGNQVMNNNFDIVDEIGELTGSTVTIFQGNTRISTNVKKDDGSRAIGTTVSKEVENFVLKKGEMYVGAANVVGTINQAAYEPIRDKNGNNIGIWYVGVPNTPYEQLANEVRNNIILFIVVELLIGVILFWIIITRSVRSLLSIVETVNRLSKGDLKVEKIKVKTKDEIAKLGISVNKLIDSFRSLIIQLNGTAEKVAVSSDELSSITEQNNQAVEHIASTMEEVAVGAENEVKSVDEIVSLMNQSNNNLSQVVQKNEQVSLHAENALEKTDVGLLAIEHAENQMESIYKNVDSLALVVEGLGKRSFEIGAITEVITEIANQTNLLSLNAAIEAARAGEHGRGFAVVSDEVRKLAEKSAQSAQQISQLITLIQEQTKKAVKSMEKVSIEVAQGTSAVNEAGKSFNQIQATVNDVTLKVEEVAITLKQTIEGSENIISSMDTISKIVEETAMGTESVSASIEEQMASMEEVASSANSLAGMADELQNQVKRFKI